MLRPLEGRPGAGLGARGGSTMKKTALLLDDPQNTYQKLLVKEAHASAGNHGIELLEPSFAGGSSWNQVEVLNGYLRASERPDALIVMPAGGESMKGTFERVLKAGIPMVLLNRIPDWVDELRGRFPEALLAGVAPDQVGIGRIQGEQAWRLVPAGAHVMLVTGTASTVAAIERERGFRERVGDRFVVNEVDGRWSAAGAEKAVGAWFRMGADRENPPRLVGCQNDPMAQGARAALSSQAAASATPELARVPLTGCDGLAEEGRASVERGVMAATVVLPPTTPAALQLLKRYWDSGARAQTIRLEALPFPSLDKLRAV